MRQAGRPGRPRGSGIIRPQYRNRGSLVDKVVLAYSGGLDTSVAIKWIAETYKLDVVCVTVDVGNERDFTSIQEKALRVGAVSAYVEDARELFVRYFCLPALQAGAVYEDR